MRANPHAPPLTVRANSLSRLEDAEWAPDAKTMLADLRAQVYDGRITPGVAADIIVHRFLRR